MIFLKFACIEEYYVYNTKSTWPLGQEVKTSPFHGGNAGSIPAGVTIFDILSSDAVGVFFI